MLGRETQSEGVLYASIRSCRKKGGKTKVLTLKRRWAYVARSRKAEFDTIVASMMPHGG
jgi:hypothetical protein